MIGRTWLCRRRPWSLMKNSGCIFWGWIPTSLSKGPSFHRVPCYLALSDFLRDRSVYLMICFKFLSCLPRSVETNWSSTVSSLPTRYLSPGSIKMLWLQMNRPGVSSAACMFWHVLNNCWKYFDLRLVWLLHVPGTDTSGASTLISGAECWSSWHRLHTVCVTPVWIWRKLSSGRVRPSCIHVPSASHLFLLLDNRMHSWQQDFPGHPSQVWCHEDLQRSRESNWSWQRAGRISSGSLGVISSKESVQLTRLLYCSSFFFIPLILMSSSQFTYILTLVVAPLD